VYVGEDERRNMAKSGYKKSTNAFLRPWFLICMRSILVFTLVWFLPQSKIGVNIILKYFR